MIKKTLLSLFLVIALLIIYFYWNLGGFNSVEIQQVKSDTKWVLGTKYYGSVKSEKFVSLFEEIGKKVQSKQVEGVLCGVYFNDPKKDSNGYVNACIGVLVDDSVQYDGYELIKIPARTVIKASITAHAMLAPSKLYPAIEDYAGDLSLNVIMPYLEWYMSEKEVFVEVAFEKIN